MLPARICASSKKLRFKFTNEADRMDTQHTREDWFRRTVYANVPVITNDLVGHVPDWLNWELVNSELTRIISQRDMQTICESYKQSQVASWDYESQGTQALCDRCAEPFDPEENIVSSRDKLFHVQCFVCSQCFQPLSCSEFYEFEGRRYCKYDFQMLFAPFCYKCGEFIMTKVIKAMQRSWHPECLVCEECSTPLVATGLQKFRGKPLCRPCFSKLADQHAGQFTCQSCRSPVNANEMLHFKSDIYHAYHFKCHQCDSELGPDARERGGDLLCLRCFDRMGIPICAACRRPVEGRIVWALGKSWHVEHFVCHQCETPFMGARFYEWQGHAYCLQHYQVRTGSLCHICNRSVTGILAKFTNKSYCPEHFTCSICDRKLNEKSKLYEIDLKPVCKECYERLPTHWKRRLAKWHLTEPAK